MSRDFLFLRGFETFYWSLHRNIICRRSLPKINQNRNLLIKKIIKKKMFKIFRKDPYSLHFVIEDSDSQNFARIRMTWKFAQPFCSFYLRNRKIKNAFFYPVSWENHSLIFRCLAPGKVNIDGLYFS